jgi:hypothetical protein
VYFSKILKSREETIKHFGIPSKRVTLSYQHRRHKKMDKQSDVPLPTGLLIMDPPGYIKPVLQDFLLTDITAEKLQDIAYQLDVDYLGPAAFPGTFPAMGSIGARNNRLMVSLVCRHQTSEDVPCVNIIFLINTGASRRYSF